MSAKKQKKFGNLKISAESLKPADLEGYLTKQGGSVKTWKKRYCILKGTTIYYYKSPKDALLTGRFDLEPTSQVTLETSAKKKYMFSVSSSKRVFMMFAEEEEGRSQWMTKIQAAVKKGIEENSFQAPEGETAAAPPRKSGDAGSMTPRERLHRAQKSVRFLSASSDSKVVEFWHIWEESMPAPQDLPVDPPNASVEFTLAVSADAQKLTWRISGPQNIFIQKMVDFFWNVGAPETEIDRLNEVGATINPLKIGSWIDMSEKGGMDGGWYFPVTISMKTAAESSDEGDAVNTLIKWAQSHGIESVYQLGRDMGAAPPRQTEVRMKLPGDDYAKQIELAIDAWTKFGIPVMPNEALKLLKTPGAPGVSLSCITSSQGFVRIGILCPSPSKSIMNQLISVASGNAQELTDLESSLGLPGPEYVEYQHLMAPFGYGVYKEGFDVVFHYNLGEETRD